MYKVEFTLLPGAIMAVQVLQSTHILQASAWPKKILISMCRNMVKCVDKYCQTHILQASAWPKKNIINRGTPEDEKAWGENQTQEWRLRIKIWFRLKI